MSDTQCHLRISQSFRSWAGPGNRLEKAWGIADGNKEFLKVQEMGNVCRHREKNQQRELKTERSCGKQENVGSSRPQHFWCQGLVSWKTVSHRVGNGGPLRSTDLEQLDLKKKGNKFHPKRDSGEATGTWGRFQEITDEVKWRNSQRSQIVTHLFTLRRVRSENFVQ